MATGYSEACCTNPPVKETHEPQGTYTTIAGLKTYQAGTAPSTHALLLIYDVFGLTAQTLHGADVLARDTPFAVFVPDFMEGRVADAAWFAGGSDDGDAAAKRRAAMAAFFAPGGPCFVPKTMVQVAGVVGELKARFGVERVGVMGYCWGAKIVSLVCGENTQFSAAVEVHPSMLAAEDAPKITVPICMLPSKDEDAEEVKKFEAALTVPKYFETFKDSPHGWMGARGDLSGPDKPNYDRGYKLALEWFTKYV